MNFIRSSLAGIKDELTELKVLHTEMKGRTDKNDLTIATLCEKYGAVESRVSGMETKIAVLAEVVRQNKTRMSKRADTVGKIIVGGLLAFAAAYFSGMMK